MTNEILTVPQKKIDVKPRSVTVYSSLTCGGKSEPQKSAHLSGLATPPKTAVPLNRGYQRFFKKMNSHYHRSVQSLTSILLVIVVNHHQS